MSHGDWRISGSPAKDEGGTERPSVEEVIERLDNLWADEPRASLAMPHPVNGRLGKYKICEVIGRGAFGIVYRAVDDELGREVALKIPRPEVLIDADKLSRFEAEATTASALDHRSIVAVYEADLSSPTPYIATAYCHGPDLGQWLAEQNAPVPPCAAATFVAQLANAVAYAHNQGVLHRDLKPSNVLLEPTSGLVADRAATKALDLGAAHDNVSRGQLPAYEPRLTDFGLAKLVEQSLQDTRSSLLVGTPLYMAPEQLAAGSHAATWASDIYALGVLLYELLTLRAPFDGHSYMELLDKIRTEEPKRLRKLEPNTPPDLEAVCLKCLEKEPARRFESASALADDLRRFLHHEPVLARPPTLIDYARKWTLRHPAAVWATLLTSLGIGAVLAVSLISLGQKNRDLATAKSGLEQAVSRETATADIAQEAERRSNDLLFLADVRLAGEALAGNNSAEARERLARHIPAEGEPDRRGFAWHYLWSQLQQELMTLTGHGPALDVEYSPDGRLLASSHESGKVVLYRAKTGEEYQVLAGLQTIVRKIEFSPNGRLLAALADNGQVCVWRIKDACVAFQFNARDPGIGEITFHPDGEKLAVTSEEWVKLYRLPESNDARETISSLEPFATLGPLPGAIYGADFSEDGLWLAAGGYDVRPGAPGYISVISLKTQSVESERRLSSRVTSVAFASVRPLLAVGMQSGQIALWDIEQDEEIASWSEHTGNVYDLAFANDDSFLASASKDVSARIWDLESLVPRRTIRGHGQRVYGTAVCQAIGQIATASKDGTVRIWQRTGRHHGERLLSEAPAGSSTARFAPDGDSLVQMRQSGWAVRHDIAGRVYKERPSEIGQLGHVCWQANGRRFALSGKVSEVAAPEKNAVAPAVKFDYDDDGDDDRIASFGPLRHVIWQENLDRVGWAAPRLFESPGYNRLRFYIKDMDGDGIEEKFTASSGDGVSLDDEVIIGPSAIGLDWADLDDDGDLDLIVADDSPGTIIWHAQEKNHAGLLIFRKRQVLIDDFSRVVPIVAAEMTGDGLPDVLAASWTAEGRIVLFENLGKGRFAEPVVVDNRRARKVLLDAADVDQDGWRDVLVASSSGMGWYRNLGGARFEPEQKLASLQNAMWTRPLPASVVVFDAESLQPEHTIATFVDDQVKTALSPDGRRLAIVERDDHFRIWDVASEQLIHSMPIGAVPVTDLVYSPDGRFLLAACGDDLRIWDAVDNRLLHDLHQHENTISSVVVSADSRRVATVSNDLSVRLWSMPEGRQLSVLEHESRPNLAAFSPDGRRLASVASDRTVQIWDVVTGQKLLVLRDMANTRDDHGTTIQDIVFRDEKRLALAVDDMQADGLLLLEWWAE